MQENKVYGKPFDIFVDDGKVGDGFECGACGERESHDHLFVDIRKDETLACSYCGEENHFTEDL